MADLEVPVIFDGILVQIINFEDLDDIQGYQTPGYRVYFGYTMC